MTQTLAIFLDAYRELNARKLFWITLVFSGLVVAAFALVGINEQGLRIIVWDFPSFLNTETMSEELFYKSMFVSFGIKFWLTWLAAILALVSTASIFPDFISGGAIDMVLSKPIGRWRLFLTKYTTGLMFVALQVSVFSAAAFLLIGIKGGAWEPSIFLAIPLVVIFFSYLFCVCTLLGIITRSTIASLMLTLVFWLFIFAVHATEVSVLTIKLMQEQQIKNITSSIEHNEAIIAEMRIADEPSEANISRRESAIAESIERRESTQTTVDRLQLTHNIVMGIKTVLPKTSETVDLLERALIDMAELPAEDFDEQQMSPEQRSMQAAEEGLLEEVRDRSVWWIIGTSLIFEAVILLFAGWLFVRRDF
jgi:ABC-type transport system involved in multi-copper enzyme maturation permease subunit